MQCQDVMRRPVQCCGEREKVDVAARRMRDANVGFLPICDDLGALVGVLTDRDIAVRVCAAGLRSDQTAVREIMTREVVLCSPGDPLARAQDLMVQHRKSRVVVAERGVPVGVISLADIARHDQPFVLETLREVSTREVVDPHGSLTAPH